MYWFLPSKVISDCFVQFHCVFIYVQFVSLLTVLRYVVAVTTGGYKDAGIDNGIVSINLIGVNGDTGLRELTGAISKNASPWQPGQADVFILEAVSIGKLKKIEVTYISPGQGKLLNVCSRLIPDPTSIVILVDRMQKGMDIFCAWLLTLIWKLILASLLCSHWISTCE